MAIGVVNFPVSNDAGSISKSSPYVCKWALIGDFLHLHCFRGSYIWPKQPKPPLSAWILWDRAIRKVFQLQRGGAIPSSHRLGRWLDFETPWQYEPSTHRLYHRSQGNWRFHSTIPTSQQSRYLRFHLTSSAGAPSNTVNCTVFQRSDFLMLTGYAPSVSAPAPTSVGSVISRLQHLPPSAKWAL